ncbi:MAG: pilin, partial [Betaproteobacteria bacterium]
AEIYSLLSGLKTPYVELAGAIGAKDACDITKYPSSVTIGKSVEKLAMSWQAIPGNASATQGCNIKGTFRKDGVNSKLSTQVVDYWYNPTNGAWLCGSGLDASIQNKSCTGKIDAPA